MLQFGHKGGEKMKGKKIILSCIILIILVLGVFFVYGKILKGKDINNSQELTAAQKVEIETFLSKMVGTSDKPYDNYFEIVNYSNEDYATLFRVVRMLLRDNKYQKNDSTYVFKFSDVKEYAKKYFMKSDFNYKDNNVQFIYDNDSDEYMSTLQFGIYDEASIDRKTAINNFQKLDNEIQVEYSVTSSNTYLGTSEINNYIISLVEDNNSFIIKSIDKK